MTDTGKGIDADFLLQVFDMFQQAEERTTRREGGLGIGLALVKQLVGMHGGRVEASSGGIGQGSRFAVWLPLEQAAAHLPAAVSPAPATLFRNKRILIVEDDALSLDALLKLLTLQGAAVTAAADAAQAIGHMEQGPFDLIISDVAMPDMDGYELMKQLRRTPSGSGITAIAVTGFGRPVDVRKALSSGFDAHVSKPLTLERLVDALVSIPGPSGERHA